MTSLRVFSCRSHADKGISGDNVLRLDGALREGSIFMADCFSKFSIDSFILKTCEKSLKDRSIATLGRIQNQALNVCSNIPRLSEYLMREFVSTT